MRAEFLHASAQLLSLANEQRGRYNYHAANIIYQAARVAADASGRPDEQSDQAMDLGMAAATLRSSSMSMEDANGLLVRAKRLQSSEVEVRTLSATVASAAAAVGEADTLRLLNKPSDAASALARLEEEEPASAADGMAGRKLCSAPILLQTFWLEAFGGHGGGEHGRMRLSTLLELATKMAAAPGSPEIIWRAMGRSCVQQREDGSADEATGDDSFGATDQMPDEEAALSALGEAASADAVLAAVRSPADRLLSTTALTSIDDPETLFDAAVLCVWRRRPHDAVSCLERLTALMPYWTAPPHLHLPDSPTRDRVRTATVLAARAEWMLGGGALQHEAVASLSMVSELLRSEWRSEPLAPAALELWVVSSWRLAEVVLSVDEAAFTAELLGPVCKAVCEQLIVGPEPSVMDKDAFLRHTVLTRRHEQIQDSNPKALHAQAAE